LMNPTPKSNCNVSRYHSGQGTQISQEIQQGR